MLIPIYKVDEERRLVFGRAAQEVPDRAGEIMDYETAKPAFKSWSEETFEASGGKSFGNVRAMHGNVAAGRLDSIEFDDAAKAIDVCAHIVDDNEWQKVLEGVYTGFSMGGKYVKRWKDESGLTRYTPSVAEISIVDRPCVPTAQFAELVKTDGTVGQLMLKGADMTDEMTEPEAKPEEAAPEAAKADDVAQAETATEEAPAVEKAEEGDGGTVVVEPEAAKADPLDDLKKYLGGEVWDASQAMGALETLTYLLQSELWEVKEGEPEPTEQLTALREAIARVKAFIVSEIQENHDEGADKADGGELAKAGARHSKGDKAHMDAIHDALCKMGYECGGAEKSEGADDLAKAVDAARADELAKFDADVVQPLAKALGLGEGDNVVDAVTKMVAERDELLAKKAEWEAQPEPSKGVARVITKADDNTEEDAVDALKKRMEGMSPEEQAREIIKFQMAHGGTRLFG